MRIVALLFAFSSTALAVHHNKMPDPPCGIPKDVFYDIDMMHAAKDCWSTDYTPCATNCQHVQSLFQHYWNHKGKCRLIRKLANNIPHDMLKESITHKNYFPTRQDCGEENNGFWKNKDGEYLKPTRDIFTLGDKHEK